MSFWQRSNRRRREERRIALPDIDWVRVAGVAMLAVVVGGLWATGRWILDRPIERVVLNGEFERVSADRLEAVLRPYMGRGFLAASLDLIHAELAALPWVAAAEVSRRWPDTIEVTIREEKPAARWGDSGLLNPQGRLFVTDADHIPAGLPRLLGPAGTETEVAARYVAIREQLVQRGLNIAALELDGRGAWSFLLSNGIHVYLGSQEVDDRLTRFYRAFDRVIADMADDVSRVDMRYNNGFAIGWKQARSREASPAGIREGSVPNV